MYLVPVHKRQKQATQTLTHENDFSRSVDPSTRQLCSKFKLKSQTNSTQSDEMETDYDNSYYEEYLAEEEDS